MWLVSELKGLILQHSLKIILAPLPHGIRCVKTPDSGRLAVEQEFWGLKTARTVEGITLHLTPLARLGGGGGVKLSFGAYSPKHKKPFEKQLIFFFKYKVIKNVY